MTTLYSATMSLDGFIAGRDGDMSWLTAHLGTPNATADSLVHRIGCLLVGGRTHRGDDPHAGTDAEGAFGGAYAGPVVVLTRSPPPDLAHASTGPSTGVEFATDVRDAVARATALAGGGYVNVLGAETARSCLEAGLLDEVLMFVAPVLLGEGVRVFDRAGGPSVVLRRRPDTGEHWYDVVR